MVEIAGLYFVIADDGRARFTRAGPDGRLHTILTVADSHVSSAPFMESLAERISADFLADVFTQLVLVASPIVLKKLTEMIREQIGACLIGALARDLVAIPDADLPRHLRRWLTDCG